MNETERWEPTAAHARATIGGATIAVGAVLARRPDLLVLAAPLLVAAVWGAAQRPHAAPTVEQAIGHDVVREGQATTWRVSVDDPSGRIEDVAVRLEPPRWVELRPSSGQVAGSLPDDGTARLVVAVRSTRWGQRRVGPALVVASSAWGAFRYVHQRGGAWALRTLPQPSPFDASAPPVRSPGLVGLSRSPRPGNGTEFAGIRPFQPGDRLRRIHWKQSLRTGSLHVTSTWADHDRHVLLLADLLVDVGESGGVDGRASSADLVLRAGAAIAEHYVSAGDRVALVVLGGSGLRRLPAGSGRRHLRRILDVMASSEPGTDPFDRGQLPPHLDPGLLVVMLSPLVSHRSLDRAVVLARRGMSVVVIDCLPPDAAEPDGAHDRASTLDPYVPLAWRMRLLERDREVRRVVEAGIAVVPWRGPGSLDLVLRDLQRQAGGRAGARR